MSTQQTELPTETAPFADIPVLPDNLQTVSEAWLNRLAQWYAAGKPEIPPDERLAQYDNQRRYETLVELGQQFAHLDFDPALHPRNPENGKFIERPFDLPDGVPDFADSSTKQTLEAISDDPEGRRKLLDTIFDPESDIEAEGVPTEAREVADVPDQPDTSPAQEAMREQGVVLGDPQELRRSEADRVEPLEDVVDGTLGASSQNMQWRITRRAARNASHM
jgi:hypothetical protein